MVVEKKDILVVLQYQKKRTKGLTILVELEYNLCKDYDKEDYR